MPSELVEPAWHEVSINLVFGDDGDHIQHGLEPFYAAERIIRDHDGSLRSRCQVGDYTVALTMYYQDSGIGALNHPSSELDTIREFRIAWEVVDQDDDVGQRSGNIHIAPRTPDMEDQEGDPISTPEDLTGVNCSIRGSNLALEHYDELLHRATQALGFHSHHFGPGRIHEEYSNIQDAARYVRLIRGESGPIHATDGVIARISNLLANDRSGYRKHVADDTDVPGYYHTVTIGPKRANELVDHHHLAKEIKHYLAREAESLDPSNPLYHPKVEVALQASRLDDPVRWTERDRVARELDETLLNLLEWEGYPITTDAIEDDARNGGDPPDGAGPYVADQYFEAQTTERNRQLRGDPTPELKDRQDHIFLRHVVDGFEESDADLLETLVSDGGQTAPKEIAEEHDWHIDTIYRAIKRLDDLVEHHYGELALRSHYIADRVGEAIQRAQENIEDAATSIARRLESTVGFELGNDALLEWVDSLGVDVKDRRDARLALRFGHVDQTRNEFIVTLTNGLREWMRAGWDRDRFLEAEIDVTLQDGRYQMPARHLLA